MRVYDIILKKRNGHELSDEEIKFFINGIMDGSIPDYQASALLMAIYFKGLNKREIAQLTMAMVNSGDMLDLSGIAGIKVDKHSTGGVGDKISLIVIPLAAAAGVPVAKISGRGLGHTGGTVDKLEAISGFNTELSKETFFDNVNKYKMSIAGQTANLTPADKKLYALRDVTATVDSIPLIASSIMSKKIASGADCIVLDVKVGSGAFMKSIDEAVLLAETMVEIGKSLNKKTIAVVSDMSQPLGHEVGNANEVKEAIEVLRGNGSEDETVVALTIASYMTVLGGAFSEFNEAYGYLKGIIGSGKALDKFKQLISIQGGNPSVIDNPELLPQAKHHIEIKSSQEGFIYSIDAESIGVAAMLLGAGRRKKNDSIDHSAGITIKKKVGERVNHYDTICILHTNLENWDEARVAAQNAFKIREIANKPSKYIYDVIQ
ncbi:pyrimidine-nucleoside phosphorylase [Lutispora sp.]|uniref:pyrimidine-nucleoside phosphorylase n=1 Tax=Lutispora sp. TaxID=2828727 RepID=UPI002B1F806C|nr:pyrimidine-nucleoside phosphorylase [Lutispora sp.]MEA4963914.1 pyrimidine-nucleoside phosphorylase [Lutispora sp.]